MQWDFQKRKVGLDWYEFLCFESPTALFASQYNVFRTMWPDPAYQTICFDEGMAFKKLFQITL